MYTQEVELWGTAKVKFRAGCSAGRVENGPREEQRDGQEGYPKMSGLGKRVWHDAEGRANSFQGGLT